MNQFEHTNRKGFWIGFVDFCTAGIFLLFYMPLNGLQKEINEILGHETLPYWKAYLLGIPTLFVYPLIWMARISEELKEKAVLLGVEGPYTSWWHMFGWNVFGLLLMGPAVATKRFFDTLNKVERALNAKAAEQEELTGPELSEESMEKATRKHLAEIAKRMAMVPFHGTLDGQDSNLSPIVRLFPTWSLAEAEGLWCAAFVYYCCRKAGFQFPYRPDVCKTCHLAACPGWEEFAINDDRIEYHRGDSTFVPEAGDIVVYDRVFENKEHDHIGIVLEKREHSILAAEGNLDNVSGIIERPIDEHIRAYIRIPDGYSCEAEVHPET